MRHVFTARIGPIRFRVGSAWRAPIAALAELYRDYPAADGVPDFTIRLEPGHAWRRWLRPAVKIGGDHTLTEAAPLPLAHALLAAEMGMNLQVALGYRRHLLLHAATVERDGRAIILTGESGSGKSTLAALLAMRGWRFMGDEFALVDLADGHVVAFPRAISLKNAAIDVVQRALPTATFGPLLRATPKGDIRHLVPSADAIARMDEPAAPTAIVLPRFGAERAQRTVPASEAFVRLTQASTNYVALGERGFAALTHLVTSLPAVAIDYRDVDDAAAMIAAL